MATQQLTQPIINPIAAFDATQPYEVTFLAIGGAQVIGNRIVISDNQTGDIIYDNRITTMKLSHAVPANTLTNGGYYNVVIYTIDSANNFSQPSVPVPFYCYSQPTLTIVNIPAGNTIENGTYNFQGSYAQQQNESLNSYQFILYDSNKTELSQSDVIYYASNNSLSYTFAGMSNDTSYYIELKGQTVNNTLVTTGLLFFTVRYSQPASFAIVDLVNDCKNGFIQISSNIVAIDGKSNPEPPIYIDNKEVDLRDPDSWVEWDKGFDIKDDFTMRVWGRDFNDFEPIITLSNKNNTDSEPNKIEMKWMIADVVKTLPEYALVSGKNVSIVNGYKTDISDLSIYGNSEQIQKDSVQLGKGNPLSLNTSSDMYLDIDIYGNQYQTTNETTPSPDSPSEIKTVGNNINFINMEDSEEKISNGMTYSIKNNVLKIKGAATANTTLIFTSKTQVNLKANTYTLNTNKNGSLTGVFGYYIYGALTPSGSRKVLIDGGNLASSTNTGIKTQTLTENNYYDCCFGIYFAKNCTTDMTLTPKLEEGSVATPYSSYNQGSVKIDVTNKNFLPSLSSSYTSYGLTTVWNGNTATINGQGTQTWSDFMGTSMVPISLKAGTYTISSTDYTYYYSFNFTFKDGTNQTINVVNKSNTITFSQDVVSYRCWIYRSDLASITFSNYQVSFQIEKGTSVTNFEQHQSQSVIMPIQKPMLDGDYIKNTERHEWNKLTLTGDESWSIGNVTIDGVQHKQFYMNLSYLSSERTKAMSNTFQNNLVQTNAKENYFYLGENLLVICNVTRLGVEITTLDDWKTYLQNQNNAGTPVIVYYKPSSITNLSLTTGQQEVQNTLINAYDQITNVYSDNDLSILNVSTTPAPSIKLPSKLYSSGDKLNQLEDLGMINVNYNQGYFQTTDTNFVLKPDFMYNLSFDYIVNSATTDLYFTISYKSNGEIFDITDAIQYSSQFTGRNNVGFIVPENIPENSTLSIKFVRTIIQANVSVSVENVSLVKGRFATNYQSPDIYNIYPTVTQKNIFNYNDVYYIRNQNATLTFIQNGFSSEVVTIGEKSFFEFGFPNVLQPGNKYAISYNSYGSIKSAKIYTMDKETGETLSQIETVNGVFTAPSNVYDIKAEFILDDSVANNQVQVWNIQLESGEQITEAELYTANNTNLKLEEPLRSIGNYKDLACLESPNILNPETQTAIVKGSTTYSLSQSGATVYDFDYINEDNNIISSESMASGQFTTPDNCVKIKFNTTSDIIKTNKLQVNLGNTALVYYPYINEPSIIRYFGEIVLTGNENISLGDSYLGIKQFNLTFNAEWVNDNIIRVASNFFKGVTFNRSWTINNSVTTVGDGNIRFMTSAYSTADEFKTFLKEQHDNGKSVVVIYKMTEQTVEPLSSDNILALQNLKTYDGVSNVFTNNSMPADINFSYINGQSEQETKNTYVTLKCWNGNIIPYFIHSNYIDIPKETDKVFIWLRRRNNIFDLKIENLGDYGEDKPGDQGNPQVAMTIDNTTTTAITVTANSIDTVTLSKLRFSKDNGTTWDAEFSLDGLSSTNGYTFTGLQPATTYQIRAEVENINGITNGITEQVITTAN